MVPTFEFVIHHVSSFPVPAYKKARIVLISDNEYTSPIFRATYNFTTISIRRSYFQFNRLLRGNSKSKIFEAPKSIIFFIPSTNFPRMSGHKLEHSCLFVDGWWSLRLIKYKTTQTTRSNKK